MSASEELRKQFQANLSSIYHEKNIEKCKEMFSEDVSYTDLSKSRLASPFNLTSFPALRSFDSS